MLILGYTGIGLLFTFFLGCCVIPRGPSVREKKIAELIAAGMDERTAGIAQGMFDTTRELRK